VIRLWRISNYCDLSGRGGERYSGRWHTARAGKPIVYITEHPAIALLETLVHLRGNSRFFPKKYQLIEIEVEPTLIEKAEPLPFDPDIAVTQATGDDWLVQKTSALAIVPSVPSPKSNNYLLNPFHSDSRLARLVECSWLTYDHRIFKAVPEGLNLPLQIDAD